MSDDRDREEPDAPTGSVFGNLPRERPGTRSPRRQASAGSRSRRSGADARGPSPAGRDESGAGHGGGSGVEDLAWAGVAIAAEAATLGVRLANRAIDAVRGPAERS